MAAVPAPAERLSQPDALLSRTDLRELGLERRAVDACFRALPVIVLPGYSRPLVRVSDYLRLLDESTYAGGPGAVRAEAWAVLNDRRAVLMERSKALEQMGLDDLVWEADALEQMQVLARIARALHAGTAGARDATVRREIQACLDAVWMHLDAPAPTDFRRVRELLVAAVEAIDSVG